MALLLGIDVGTTHTKALIVDERGVTKAFAAERTVIQALPDGGAVHDPGELWQSVVAVIRKALTQVTAGEVAAVAVASFGEAGVLIDAEGQPAGPVMAWYDQRPQEVGDRLTARLGRDFFYQTTGMPADAIFTVFKLAWMREQDPEAFGRGRRWLSIDGFVNQRLCGAQAMDLSQAARTLALDVRRGTWSLEIIEGIGLPPLFPELKPSGMVLGRVSPQVARETMLPAGTPVVLGGHDHVCGSLAVGCTEPGCLLDSMGTAESLLLLQRILPPSFSTGQMLRFGRHVVPDRFYCAAALPASGASLNWVLDTVGGVREDNRAVRQAEDYRRMLIQAENRPPGARGVLFLPHLMGSGPPEWDAAATGAFLGLRPHHTTDDLYRAVIEGLSLEFRHVLREIERADGYVVRLVRATGGGARNPFWLKVKAAATGLPIQVPEILEATAMGAALLAGTGVGLYAGLDEAVQATLRIAEVHEPDPALAPVYDGMFSAYEEVRSALFAVNRRLEWSQGIPVPQCS